MTKRTFLRVAGMCLALLSPVYAQNTASSTAPSQPQPATSQLIIYHAGSLTAAFKKIEAAFMAEHPGVAIVDKFGGSVNLARQVTVGGEPADLYASADYEDIDVLLKPKWANYTIRFAQGAMVLVYKINDPNPLAKVERHRRSRRPLQSQQQPSIDSQCVAQLVQDPVAARSPDRRRRSLDRSGNLPRPAHHAIGREILSPARPLSGSLQERHLPGWRQDARSCRRLPLCL